jgi:DNA-nicking Smr family endonuclease
MAKADRKTRPLSQGERELWRQVTRDARPFERRRADSAFTEALREEIGRTEASEAERARPAAPKTTTPAPGARTGGEAEKTKPRAPAPLVPGRFADLDKRTAERLRRGKLSIEAALDLHGMTQDRAHAALDSFVARAFDAGLRCVVVVTGKGARSPEGGVLRKRVPMWLNQPGNREKLLAICHAQPQHGGEGALYLLLKRRRGQARG